VIGFADAVSLWWRYFVRHDLKSEEITEHTPEPTRLGRTGFAYGQGIMVTGIMVVAVAINLTMILYAAANLRGKRPFPAARHPLPVMREGVL